MATIEISANLSIHFKYPEVRNLSLILSGKERLQITIKHRFNRVAIACLTFLLISSTLFMLTATSVKAATPPTTQTIQGTVYDHDTGSPIPNAGIIVNFADGSSVDPTVDSNGFYTTTFSTDNPPISVEATAQNYDKQFAMDIPTSFDQPITRDFYMQLANPVLDKSSGGWTWGDNSILLSLSTTTPNELIYLAAVLPSTQAITGITSNPDFDLDTKATGDLCFGQRKLGYLVCSDASSWPNKNHNKL